MPLLLWGGSSGTGASQRSTILSDNFNRADAANLGANWDVYTSFQTPQVVTNTCRALSAGVNAASGWSAGPALNNNQYAKAQIASWVDSDSHVGVICRGSIGANNNFYLLIARRQGNTQLYRVDAGVLNPLAFVANPGWAVNDTVELEVIGTTLTAFRNGSSISLTSSDGIYASGRAGIWVNSNVSINNVYADNWEAGNTG